MRELSSFFVAWLVAFLLVLIASVGRGEAAQRAFRTATRQWPGESLGWFALANSRYASGDAPGAEEALRKSLVQQPDFAAGWFNLSEVLGERGCQQAAEQARACARRLAPEDKRFAAADKPIAAAAGQCALPPACPLNE